MEDLLEKPSVFVGTIWVHFFITFFFHTILQTMDLYTSIINAKGYGIFYIIKSEAQRSMID